jgi:ribonuclease HII
MAARRRSGKRPARRRWSDIEREMRKQGGPLIAGVDEVGRGPLAGPVVACAVIMPPDQRAIRGVDDSKALTAAQRERLASVIRERALAIGVGAASVREIDRLNIYHASTLAMRRALARLPLPPDHVLIDGKAIRSLTIRHTAVVHGDARCFSIACASIIAKVTRDRLMRLLAERYPSYQWAQNAGYATPDHVAGLAAAGLTPHHRRSFMRIRQQLTLDFDAPPEHHIEIELPVAILADMAANTTEYPAMPNVIIETEHTGPHA